LGDDVEKVQQLADEKLNGVEVVRVQVVGEVVHQQFNAFGLLLFGDHYVVEAVDQYPYAAALQYFPYVPGHVEEQGLEEQNETHPLVVLVVLDDVFALPVGPDARLNDVFAHAAADLFGHGERRVYPTIRIHDLIWHTVHHAVYRVTDVLPGGDDQRERDEHDDGRFVVQPEHVVVDAHGVQLQQIFHGTENVDHSDAGCR